MRLATLLDLPSELLCLIVGELSWVDATCLGLCNRPLRALLIDCQKLKSSPIRKFLGSQCALRVALLNRLARDWPQYYLCYDCSKLHRWRKMIDLSGSPGQLKPCSGSSDSKYMNQSTRLWCIDQGDFLHRFHFVYLHLVMRRFYFGPSYGIPAKSLMFTKAMICPLPLPQRSGSQMMRLLSLDAWVCPEPPSMCLRTQDLVLIRGRDVPFLSAGSYSKRFEICTHQWNGEFNWKAESQLDEMNRRQGQDVGMLSDHGVCEECNTTWKLELRKCGEGDICHVLTCWKDLGPGLDPRDYRWRVHMEHVPLKARGRPKDPPTKCAASESDSLEALSEKQLYLRNLSILQDIQSHTATSQQGPTIRPQWIKAIKAEAARKAREARKARKARKAEKAWQAKRVREARRARWARRTRKRVFSNLLCLGRR